MTEHQSPEQFDARYRSGTTSAVFTFRDAAHLYMRRGGESRYLLRLTDFFGDRPLADIDQEAIDQAAKILLPSAATSTQNRQVHGPASATLKCAAEHGLCSYRRIKRPFLAPARAREISRVEANKLIKACSGRLRPFVIMLFFVDIGPGKLLRLDWSHVDLDRGVLKLRKRNGSPVLAPLVPQVVSCLLKLPYREGPLFRTPTGREYSHKRPSIKTAFKAACLRAGIADLAPRDCRNALGSRKENA